MSHMLYVTIFFPQPINVGHSLKKKNPYTSPSCLLMAIAFHRIFHNVFPQSPTCGHSAVSRDLAAQYIPVHIP